MSFDNGFFLQELVVDDASEEPTSPHNGAPSPRENGLDKLQPKKEHPPHSPRSIFALRDISAKTTQIFLL